MQICRECGTVGRVKKITPGSIFIELVLWCCFIIPGLIYSFWRLSKRHSACAVCGAANLLPVESPAGKKMLAEFGHVPKK